MKESAVERHLRARTLTCGGGALKFVSPGNAVVPDRLIVPPTAWCPCCGRSASVCLVEVKRPGETPRELKVQQRARPGALRLHARCVDSKDGVAPGATRDGRGRGH